MLLRRILKVQNSFKKYNRFLNTLDIHENVSSVDSTDKKEIKRKKSPKNHSERINSYMISLPFYNKIENEIPEKYLHLKKRDSIALLYILDERIASSVYSHIVTKLNGVKNKLICETNAGFGFISQRLLEDGAKVRMYETCPEFRKKLQTICKKYSGTAELYVKDLYHLSSMSFIDKMDRGNRVSKLLCGLPKVPWNSDPAITIVGPMPNYKFLLYLIRMVVYQAEIIDFGRVELFAIIRSKNYTRINASPELGCNKYHSLSILYQLFFEYKLLEIYERDGFIPWETKTKTKSDRTEDMYLVYMVMKEKLPVPTDLLLPLYYFVRQGFGRGRKKVIPTLEKWLPGCGKNLITSSTPKNLGIDLNIFTEFGELSPNQILFLFKEMVKHPDYKHSPFIGLMEAELLKMETVESDTLDEQSVNKNNIETFKDELHV